ncbi:peptide chain release factor 2 [Candidatus Saccharibacteria bacterium]|nr:peptide chain release factor 2 [Candidatus Saccharibacteria bacterium]
MSELFKRVEKLQTAVKPAAARLKLTELNKQLAGLEQQMAEPDFWQDPSRARSVSKRQAEIQKQAGPWNQLQAELDELAELAKIGDAAMNKEIEQQIAAVELKFESLQKELRFNGPYDDHDVILAIYAGAGGTDAQDWAQMLLRMYQRYAESGKLRAKTLDISSGEEAGLKSATVEISGGANLYGQLAGEHGVHRLVRLSPFNADHKRQTSFAKVEVLPKIDRPSEVEIDDKDLKIDVFRSAGAGGQSVNTTDSAVRVTHQPTGLTVAIQNERSQLQNKETALAVLRSRLAALQLEQHAAGLKELKGPSQSAEWGNQIRSYVLHPYKQVKDLRTGFESNDPQAVLDGKLEPLIEAWLANKLPSN